MTTLTATTAEHACHLDSFVLAGDFEQTAQGRQLPPKLWELAQALKTPARAAELAPALKLPAEAVLGGLLRLEAEGIVSRYMIHCPWLAQPARATSEQVPAGAQTAAPAPLTASIPVSASTPESAPRPAPDAQTTQATPAPAQNKQEEPAAKALETVAKTLSQPEAKPLQPSVGSSVKFSLSARSRAPKAQGTAQPLPKDVEKPGSPPLEKRPGAISLKLAASRKPRQDAQPEAAAEAAVQGKGAQTQAKLPAEGGKARRWAIQPVLDALRLKAGGDPMVGQLLAYRVFLRVPKELLDAAGIRSVCLIEPDLVIEDMKLKQAIDQALLDVTGLVWPKPLTQAA